MQSRIKPSHRPPPPTADVVEDFRKILSFSLSGTADALDVIRAICRARLGLRSKGGHRG